MSSRTASPVIPGRLVSCTSITSQDACQTNHLVSLINQMTTDLIFERAEKLCLLATEDPALIPEYLEAQRIAKSLENSGWKRRTGMTQNQIIMKHLKKAGSITVREALIEYSIQSLTKRIQELREAGNQIVSTVKYHPVTRQKYVRYSLGEA